MIEKKNHIKWIYWCIIYAKDPGVVPMACSYWRSFLRKWYKMKGRQGEADPLLGAGLVAIRGGSHPRVHFVICILMSPLLPKNPPINLYIHHLSTREPCLLWRAFKQIDPDALEGIHCPSRISFLLPLIQVSKEVLDKLWISIFHDGFPSKPHQVQLVMDIVHRQQVSSCCLFGRDMVDVGTSNTEPTLGTWTTARTIAPFFNGPKVFGINSITKI